MMGIFKYLGFLRSVFRLPMHPSWRLWFRVSADIEIKGMDTEKHNEPAYPDIAQGHGYEKEIYGRLARNSVTPADTFTNGIPNGVNTSY